jgi:hypothetical protein
MRPRIKPNAVLVARSTDTKSTIQRNTGVLEKIPVDKTDKRPFVMIFDKKLYINPNEIDYYVDNGFTVFQPK